MRRILRSLIVYVLFTVLLGLVYPLAVTFIAQTVMPYKANGSLILNRGTVIGSELIGQGFTDLKYFHSRFSTNNYDGTNSGATNLGPSSKKLMDDTAEKINKARQEYKLNPDVPIPADMVLASASGLDPHITLENALIQSTRIAEVRGISVNDLKKLIDDNTDSDFVGIWGCPGVNVLKLNIDLDNFGNKLK